MEQNQFRIGGVYRNGRGDVVRIDPMGAYDSVYWETKLNMPEHSFGWPGRISDGEPCRFVSLVDGRSVATLRDGFDENGSDLVSGELTHIEGKGWVPVNERGEPIETQPETLESLVAQITPENRHEVVWNAAPKRAPLPYFTERASSDRFPGFTVKSTTTEQPRERVFCDSPDMLPASHQAAPGFGSALLKV